MAMSSPDIGVRIGLGTFSFSNVFSEVDQRKAAQIVEAFVVRGGRFLETAPVYAVNRVDLGEIISELPRDRLFVATKCVTGFRDGARVRSGDDTWIRSQVDSELKRLRVDQLDLLQAHILPEDTPLEKFVQTLASIRDSGRVRFIGLSNVNRDELSLALKVAPIDFVQNRFSFLHRRGLEGVGALAVDRGITLNPYQTIERGQLTSFARRPDSRSPGDIRNSKHEYAGEAFATVRAWVEDLVSPIAASLGVKLETLATAWTLAQNPNVMPVVGFTSADQLAPIFDGLTLNLSGEVIREMDSAFLEMQRRARDRFGLTLDEYRGIT